MTIIERVWLHNSALKNAKKDKRFLRVVRGDGDWLYCSFVNNR